MGFGHDFLRIIVHVYASVLFTGYTPNKNIRSHTHFTTEANARAYCYHIILTARLPSQNQTFIFATG